VLLPISLLMLFILLIEILLHPFCRMLSNPSQPYQRRRHIGHLQEDSVALRLIAMDKMWADANCNPQPGLEEVFADDFSWGKDETD
jgi:hypothetical protein